MKTKQLTKLSLLTAIALSLFVVEMRIPNPINIPRVKLGLANIITVYAVYCFKKSEVILMVATKVILGSIFSGQLVSIIYSVMGNIFCLAGMFLLKNIIPINYLWLSSIFGAIFHNIGQILAAIILTQSPALIAYLPFLLISGCLAGLCTGLCAQIIVKRLSQKAKA